MANAKDYAFRDATESLTIHVTQDDIDGAVPGSSRDCVISRAVRREHRCFDVTLFRTVAYVRKSERSIPVRYQVTASVHDVLMTFDASGRSHPISVTLMPPRWGISAAFHRTKGAKQAKKRYREKAAERQSKRGVGKRRMYTKPDPLTLLGVRNGRGAKPFSRMR